MIPSPSSRYFSADSQIDRQYLVLARFGYSGQRRMQRLLLAVSGGAGTPP